MKEGKFHGKEDNVTWVKLSFKGWNIYTWRILSLEGKDRGGVEVEEKRITCEEENQVRLN